MRCCPVSILPTHYLFPKVNQHIVLDLFAPLECCMVEGRKCSGLPPAEAFDSTYGRAVGLPPLEARLSLFIHVWVLYLVFFR